MAGGRGGWKGRQGLDRGGLALGARLRSWISLSRQWEPWRVFELERGLISSALGAMGRMRFGEERPAQGDHLGGCCFGVRHREREEWENHFRGICRIY